MTSVLLACQPIPQIVKPDQEQNLIAESSRADEKIASREQASLAYLSFVNGYWQVFLIREDGSNKRQVSNSHYDKSRISWYPNGRHILINANQGSLHKLDVETGEETALPAPFKGMTDAVISPDGQSIIGSVSTADSFDASDLWLFTESGKEKHKLTHMKWLQHEPNWDAVGQWVYFLSGKGGQTHDIWRLSLKSKQTEQLTTGSLYHFDVSVSSDHTMAYSSNRGGYYDIWIQKNNQAPKPLTQTKQLDARPAWSSDDSKIAYESANDGVMNIWIMNVDGTNANQLTRSSVGARFPVWKPDNKKNN